MAKGKHTDPIVAAKFLIDKVIKKSESPLQKKPVRSGKIKSTIKQE